MMNITRTRKLMFMVGIFAVLSKGTHYARKYFYQLFIKSNESKWKLFSVFLSDLQANRIRKVLLGSNYCIVHSEKAYHGIYKVRIPPNTPTSYILTLLQRGPKAIAFGAISPNKYKRWGPILLGMLPFIYLGLTYRMLQRMFGANNIINKTLSGKSIGKESKRKNILTNVDSSSTITFQDVAGIDDARYELEEIVDFLKHPKRYHAIGAKVPKGVLLCGPSGTGKTLLARAVAGEANVTFLFCSASDFVEMLVGRGAARVRELFTKAATYKQCIIFIDEIDALAKSRGGLNSNDEREQTLNQLLTEMDGFESNYTTSNGENNGEEQPILLVIAATNRREILDPAITRPGRFDRHVYVGYPDVKGREAILKVHVKNIQMASDVNLSTIAHDCSKYFIKSGAQIASLVNEAALLAVRHGATKVTQWHFQKAMERAYETQLQQ